MAWLGSSRLSPGRLQQWLCVSPEAPRRGLQLKISLSSSTPSTAQARCSSSSIPINLTFTGPQNFTFPAPRTSASFLSLSPCEAIVWLRLRLLETPRSAAVCSRVQPCAWLNGRARASAASASWLRGPLPPWTDGSLLGSSALQDMSCMISTGMSSENSDCMLPALPQAPANAGMKTSATTPWTLAILQSLGLLAFEGHPK